MIGHPLKVRQFIDEIASGQVVLPEIQRGYVWKGPQASKLMDSLYREYPIGQVLLWDPKTFVLPTPRYLRGAAAADLPAVGTRKVVLDGQQRLTSIWMALGKSTEQLDISFNVGTETFQLYLKSKMKNDPYWVSVREVVNDQRSPWEIVESIEEAGGPGPRTVDGRVFLERLQRLRDVAKFEIPIEIFQTEDYDRVTELFVRVNQGGTRLREAELALAQLALRMPGAVADKFDAAMDSYEKLDFELDTRFLMRVMTAIGTGQSRFRHLGSFWARPPKELDLVWRRTHKALDSVVNFTRKNARFESSDWLPSVNALVPLAVYFDRHQAVVPDEVGLLRWFYTASLRGRYSTSAETAMDEDIKAALSPEPVAELMRNIGTRAVEVHPDEFDDAGRLNPLFALSYAAAKKNGAKDWFYGIAVGKDAAGDEHKVEIHHVFPKKVVKELKVSRKDRDEIANLAFLARRPNEKISATPPDEYLPQIAKHHPDRLRAQCIPMDSELWKPKNFHKFLAERRRLLADEVNALIASP